MLGVLLRFPGLILLQPHVRAKTKRVDANVSTIAVSSTGHGNMHTGQKKTREATTVQTFIVILNAAFHVVLRIRLAHTL